MIHSGDCLTVLPTLEAGSVDAVITDPPYGLEFMGKEWDKLWHEPDNSFTVRPKGGDSPFNRRRPSYGTDGPKMQTWHQQWAAATLRVLKPGGYLLAFGGTRTFHRLACALEDAGFEIRDTLCWLYGSGFPKGKGCLKPAWEPILLCRRPGPRVLPLGVDECRVPYQSDADYEQALAGTQRMFDNVRDQKNTEGWARPWNQERPRTDAEKIVKLAGRYPANCAHDGSEEVLEAFAAFGERKVNRPSQQVSTYNGDNLVYAENCGKRVIQDYADTGTAARFFYCAKASRRERGEGNNHPTVKPLALIEWLVKLVCPEGGTVLDPFLGSGTTALACLQTGRKYIGIEKDEAYVEIARRRIREVAPLFAE